MIELHLFGGVRLSGAASDADLDAVIAQPRRLAVLAYLACARPRGPVSRDTLLGVFWPEQAQSRARRSLNQSLYFLRKHLGADIFLTPNRESVAIDPERLWCDAVEFDARLDAGTAERALGLYEGDLLKGVFLTDAVEFERWLDGERDRMRRRALAAATHLATEREAAGDTADAVHWLREALRVEPTDETLLRRLIGLLAGKGDRVGARRELSAFEKRLREEFELPLPSDLERLLEPETTYPTVPSPPAEMPGGATVVAVSAPPPADAPPAVPDRTPGDAAVEPTRFGRRRALAAATIVLIVAAIAGLRMTLRSPATAETVLEPRRLLVAAFTDATGDPDLASLGGVATDWLAQELARTRMVEVLPWSMVAREAVYLHAQADTLPADAIAREIARAAGAAVLVTGSWFLRGDSVVVQARVADVRTGALLRAIESEPVPRSDPLRAIDVVRNRLAGALATLYDPRLASWSAVASQPPSFAAYRVYTDAVGAALESRGQAADSLFMLAAALDTTFTAPLVWALRNAYENVSFDRLGELIRRLQPRRHLLAPWDEAVLDYYESRLEGEWEESYRHARRLAEIAPVSEWSLLRLQAAAATRRFGDALGVATRLDFERGWLREWRHARALPLELHHLLGDYEAELRAASQLEPEFPRSAATARLRALAALGRLDAHADLLEQAIAGLDPPYAASQLEIAAAELRGHGHAQAAHALLERALRLHESQGAAGRRPGALARTYRALGRFDDARAQLDRMLRAGTVPRDVVLRELALTAAAAGQADEALRLIGEVLDSRERDGGWASLEAARVHAALGDRDAAVRFIRRSRAEGSGFYFWMHVVPEFETLRGHAPFEELMRPRS